MKQCVVKVNIMFLILKFTFLRGYFLSSLALLLVLTLPEGNVESTHKIKDAPTNLLHLSNIFKSISKHQMPGKFDQENLNVELNSFFAAPPGFSFKCLAPKPVGSIL